MRLPSKNAILASILDRTAAAVEDMRFPPPPDATKKQREAYEATCRELAEKISKPMRERATRLFAAEERRSA
jgi:hypothetical protein